jgi:hypothetical protein
MRSLNSITSGYPGTYWVLPFASINASVPPFAANRRSLSSELGLGRVGYPASESTPTCRARLLR